jgi:hypothetical protein
LRDNALGASHQSRHRAPALDAMGFARSASSASKTATISSFPRKQRRKIQADLGDHVPKLEDQPWPRSRRHDVDRNRHGDAVRRLIMMHEKMFESRLFFVDKLITMGAKIVLCDPHRALVAGPSALRGATLDSPDIRAGMALLIAALGAEGQSIINNVGQIERGYERIDERWSRSALRCGAWTTAGSDRCSILSREEDVTDFQSFGIRAFTYDA